jgi:hypothetical protein
MSNSNDKRRITKMRKAPADSKHDAALMLTALEDILLTIGDARTETDHRIKLIAERAIAKGKRR